MLPGPDYIIACPHCAELARYFTLSSGNTAGAVQWSDGLVDAPMLPIAEAVVRCRNCRKFYWRDDAEFVGTLDDFSSGRDTARPDAETASEWRNAQPVGYVTEHEYYEALDAGLAPSPHEERLLRSLAWWRRNDEYRYIGDFAGCMTLDISTACRSNLEVLDGVLENHIDDRLLRVELRRELGDFGGALDELRNIHDAHTRIIVERLRWLVEQGDMCVRNLADHVVAQHASGAGPSNERALGSPRMMALTNGTRVRFIRSYDLRLPPDVPTMATVAAGSIGTVVQVEPARVWILMDCGPKVAVWHMHAYPEPDNKVDMLELL